MIIFAKIAAFAAYSCTCFAILGGYSSMSSFCLGQDKQPFFWSHHATEMSGPRSQIPPRIIPGNFRGGGPSTPK